MKERKRMLMPGDPWDTGAMESWLEEQARLGWRLIECGSRFAKFQRSEPARVRYRLEPISSETFEACTEREALYEEMGWCRAACLQHFRIYENEDLHAPELETDPVAAAWVWNRILKKERRNLILTWLVLAAAVAFAVYRIFSSETPVETLIRSVSSSAPLVLLMLPWMIWKTAVDLHRIRLLRRQMAAGLPRSHTGDWRKQRRQVRFTFTAILLLYLLMISYPMNRMSTSWGADLDELDRPVPCLMGWQLDDSLTEADRTSGVCLMNPTFLNPGHYDVWDHYPGDRSVINQCDILLFSFLAEPLYREWQGRMRELAEAEVTELEHPGFDGVTLGRRGGNTYLLVWQDKIVLYVGAFGVSGAEDHLDDYAALLKTFQ